MRILALISMLFLFPLSVGEGGVLCAYENDRLIEGSPKECDATFKQPKYDKVEEYREKCEEYLAKMRSGTCDAYDLDCATYNSSELANIATAYCTRALLEEISK